MRPAGEALEEEERGRTNESRVGRERVAAWVEWDWVGPAIRWSLLRLVSLDGEEHPRIHHALNGGDCCFFYGESFIIGFGVLRPQIVL